MRPEKPISEEEIAFAISTMKSEKCPGPDSFNEVFFFALPKAFFGTIQI